MNESVERLLADTVGLRSPLAGDAPAGLDLALEPDFEPIKNEIEKLSSLEGGTPDWAAIVRGAEEMLASRTKDLRLAVWMAAGAAHTRGWHGLARGLVVCRSYVVDLWESVFPTRAKARSNIIGWLAERVAPLLHDLPVRLEDADDVRAVAQLVADLDREMADRLGDGFGGIRALVNETKKRVDDIPLPPPPTPPPPPPPPPPTPPPPAEVVAPVVRSAAAAPVTGALSTKASDADATTRTTAQALVALARSVAMVEPARAWAYAMHRKGIWLRVETVPAVIEEPPEAGLRERLALLAGESRWIELVFAGEEASAQHPLWLDPHRFVAIALERLGSAFNDARAVVGRDTSDFARPHMARFTDARFSDGTPLASIDTVEWLETESKRWLRATEADVARDEDRELALRFAEARHLVAGGRHADGLAIAVQLARRGSDPRDRFRSSLDVARLAAEAGAHDVARPILESLRVLAHAHALDEWEPVLAARLYAGLYRTLSANDPEREKAFEMLCRIDPGRALRLQGRGRTEVRPVTGNGAGAFESVIASVTGAFTEETTAAPDAPPPSSGDKAETQWADDWD